MCEDESNSRDCCGNCQNFNEVAGNHSNRNFPMNENKNDKKGGEKKDDRKK